MKKTESKLFFDSSAWLAYFFAENKKVKELIETEGIVFTSVISIFEIKRKLLRDDFDLKRIAKVISFIKNRSIIINLTEKLCEKSAEDSIKFKLHTTDSLIYTPSQEKKSLLITGDEHFKKLRNVELL